MTLSSEQIYLAFSILESCKSAVEFRQKLENSPELLKLYTKDIVLKVIQENKVELFGYLSATILDPNIKIGEFDQPILTYLISRRDLGKRPDFIKILLNNPTIKVDSEDRPGSVLHNAIDEEDSQLFYALIDCPYVNLKAENVKGETPLLHAITSKKLTYAQTLLDRNVFIERNSSSYVYKNFLSRMFKNAEIIESPSSDKQLKRTYSLDWQQFIKDVFKKLNSHISNSKIHPFFEFCLEKQDVSSPESKIDLKLILDSLDFNIGNLRFAEYRTLAMMAAEFDNVELLNILKEIEDNCFNMEDFSGSTVAHYLKSIEAARLALTSENMSHVNGEGFSPLFSAISRGENLDLINYLIDEASIFCDSGSNILHILSRLKLSKDITTEKLNFVVEGIFEKLSSLKIDIEALLKETNQEGLTPLEESCVRDNLLIFDSLLKKEKEHEILSFTDGRVLTLAAEAGCVEIVKHILILDKNSENRIPEEFLLELSKNTEIYAITPLQRKCKDLLDYYIGKYKPHVEIEQNPVEESPIEENFKDLVANNQLEQQIEDKATKNDSLNNEVDGDPAPETSSASPFSRLNTLKTYIAERLKFIIVRIKELFHEICTFFRRITSYQQETVSHSRQISTKIDKPVDTPPLQDENLNQNTKQP